MTSHSFVMTRRLIQAYMRPRLKLIVAVLLLMMVSAATTGAMAKLMEPVIDQVFTAKDDSLLWVVASAIFLVFFVRGFATYGEVILTTKIGQQITNAIQCDMFKHLVHADLAYFQGEKSGQLQARFFSAVSIVRQALVETLTGIGKNFFTLAVLLCIMFLQDWKLSIAAFFVFPILGAVVTTMGRKMRQLSRSMQIEAGELNTLLSQAFRGSKHIKAHGTESYEIGRITHLIMIIDKLVNKSTRVSAFSVPLGEMLSGVAIITLVLYGGYQVMEGLTTAGKLLSFITAFILAFEPMKRLTRLYPALQRGLASAERLFEVFDREPLIQDKPDAAALTVAHPNVTFEAVKFIYPDGTVALDDVSFTAPAGKMVALVGASGAGKTTVLNLIPRFYDVSAGRVLIGGVDVRDVTTASLRSHMAIVSQDVSMFFGTVRDNTCYGRPNATDADIEAAARQAAAHDFIMALPGGYDAQVGEAGVKLSGGQKQRIAIARAMLRDAPVLLLDEATSALDATSERLVQEALARLQEGRTTIVVAHRLSTIMNADIIYVFDRGRVIEQGTHDTLMAKGDAYATLYAAMRREGTDA